LQECSYHKDKRKPTNDDDDEEDDDDVIVRMISTLSERGVDTSAPQARMASDEAASKLRAGHAPATDSAPDALSSSHGSGDEALFDKHRLGHWETMVADRLGAEYEVVELVVLRHMRLIVSANLN
jgi:hypothetical protein